MSKINFEYNGYKLEALSFDNKKNTLKCKKIDKDGKNIGEITLTMGQIPKKVKQAIKPLKK